MTDFSRVPGVDITVPNAARMYDYLLGGSHNFEADRAAGDRARQAMPWIADALRANRAFLGRAVRWCTAQGIDQFLDLGSGIPTAGNVHEVAREGGGSARVAYVDNEPVTVACSTALLDGDPLSSVTRADIRDVDAVLTSVGDLLDLSRPVALLTVAVLHFLPDADDPAGLVRRYRARLAPGSVHALTHATADHDPEEAAGAQAAYAKTANPVWARTRAEVAGLLTGTDLVEPGLVDATQWHLAEGDAPGHAGYWAAIGRIG